MSNGKRLNFESRLFYFGFCFQSCSFNREKRIRLQTSTDYSRLFFVLKILFRIFLLLFRIFLRLFQYFFCVRSVFFGVRSVLFGVRSIFFCVCFACFLRSFRRCVLSSESMRVMKCSDLPIIFSRTTRKSPESYTRASDAGSTVG